MRRETDTDQFVVGVLTLSMHAHTRTNKRVDINSRHVQINRTPSFKLYSTSCVLFFCADEVVRIELGSIEIILAKLLFVFFYLFSKCIFFIHSRVSLFLN